MRLINVSQLAIYGGVLLVLQSILFNCQSGSPKGADQSEGAQLAQQYCGSCHLPVEPGALDKETWSKHVLPAMAQKLGLEVWQTNHYYQPQTARIPLAEWTRLVDYYVKQAPDKARTAPASEQHVNAWAIFKLIKPSEDKSFVATTTLVVFDTTSHQIYSGSETDPALYRWNSALRPERIRSLHSPAVQATFTTNAADAPELALTCIGTMLAVDKPLGELTLLNPTKPTTAPVTVAGQLPRPIQSVPGDFNRDGRRDWIVCGFGHNQGGLYYLQQRADNQFDKRIISEVPGATQVIPGDFNQDGWPDFMALFAHADEGIWLFTNNKAGGFTERNILRFPPVYGSTSFQLIDFNRDGRLDILYTCGDNSDYSRILKPFHGIYLFLNEGNHRYKHAWFKPLDGCTKAVAADFDQDGDLDIAAIAFFADLQNPAPQTFVYLEQTRPSAFIPHAVPIQAYGRWICMDVNDWDNDHDPDIVLGNYAKGFMNEPGLAPGWNSHVPLIVLENTSPHPIAAAN